MVVGVVVGFGEDEDELVPHPAAATPLANTARTASFANGLLMRQHPTNPSALLSEAQKASIEGAAELDATLADWQDEPAALSGLLAAIP